MSTRSMVPGAVLALLLGAAVSCMPPVSDAGDGSGSEEAIQGIGYGDDAEQVIAVLGPPKARASGWWFDSFTFDMNFKVWYYKGQGRVIFNPEGLVYASEADPDENGRPW